MTSTPESLVFCPRCDRAYLTVELASKHVDEAHPEQLNPFRQLGYVNNEEQQ